MKKGILRKVISCVSSAALAICMLSAVAFAEEGASQPQDSVNFTVNLSQDMNWKTGNNWPHPIVKFYKTAGVENGYDYVGTYEKDGKTEYVYEPANYIISGNASDGWTIKESEKGDSYPLSGYEPIAFTDSSFGAGTEGATQSGTVSGGYRKYFFAGAPGTYSFRGYGYAEATSEEPTVKLGGMKLDLPVDGSIYNGPADSINTINLRVYTNSATASKVDPETLAPLSPAEYLGLDDFQSEVVLSAKGTKVHVGDPYSTNEGRYNFYPYLVYAGGTNCFYNRYIYPRSDVYSFDFAAPQAISMGNAVLAGKTMIINPAVVGKFTVPTDAEFSLHLQISEFDVRTIKPADVKENGDGTSTYSFPMIKSNAKYSWRLADSAGKFVTKAGWLPSQSASFEMNLGFDANSAADKKVQGFDKLGTTVTRYDEADIQAFVSGSGYKHLGADESVRVNAYRTWQIADSTSTGAVMIDPDYNWTTLSGNASISTVNAGNSKSRIADIDPNGTAVVAVTYDAIDVFNDTNASSYGNFGGLFPASATNRTSVFVLSDEAAGTADASISYNKGTDDNKRPENWDYNYDTWYYLDTDEAPALDFTVSGDSVSKVEAAIVTTAANGQSKMSGFSPVVSGEGGKYSFALTGFKAADTKGGTVVIKMTDANGVSYRLVRAAELSVVVENVTKPGENIEPGDSVKVKFDGTYRGMNKVPTVMNPSAMNIRYTSGQETTASLTAYYALDNSEIAVKVPTDIAFEEGKSATSINYENGYVYSNVSARPNVFETMYFDSEKGAFSQYNTFSKFSSQRLPDFSITVNKAAAYNVKMAASDEEGAIEDASFVITSSDGAAVSAGKDGVYVLGVGTYNYVVKAAGHATTRGTLSVGKRMDGGIVDGIYTNNVEMKKLGADAWDGSSIEEAPCVDGTYEISNAKQLAWWAKQVNTGKAASSSAKLTNDIELASNDWTAIGTSSNPFTGSFDGRGHEVKGLYYAYEGSSSNPLYFGLFGYVAGSADVNASVKNVAVQGEIFLKGKAGSDYCEGEGSNAAGVVGYAKYCTIEGAVSKVDIQTTCSANGSFACVAGIAGEMDYAEAINCINYGSITGASSYVGGIAGTTMYSSVDSCINRGALSGYQNPGGIVGYIYTSTKKVVNCINFGNVTAASNWSGGISGRANAVGCLIDNCLNAGNVAGGNYFGGVIGGPTGNNMILSNLYSLEGACAVGYGYVSKYPDTVASVTAEQISSGKMADSMNANAGTILFRTDDEGMGLLSEKAQCPICKTATATVISGAHDACAAKKAFTGDAVCAVCGAVKVAGFEYGELADAHVIGEDYICAICGFHDEVADLTDQLSAALDAKSEVENALAEANSNLEAKTAELSEVKEALDAAKGQIETDEKAIANLNTQVAGLEEQISDLAAAKDALQKQLEEAEAAIAAANEAIVSKDATIAEKQAAIDAALAQVEQLGAAKSELEAANAALNEQVASLNSSIDQLQRQAASNDEVIEQLKRDLAQARLDGVPANLAVSVAWNKVSLKWDANEFATSYVVTRDGARIYSGTATSLTDAGVKLGKSYSYKVTPVLAYAKDVTLSGRASAAAAKPALAQASTKAKAGKGKVKVAWKKVAGAKGYKLWVKVGKKKAKTIAVKSASKTKKVIKKLKKGASVKVKVRAMRGSSYGAWSAAKVVKVK